MAVQPASQLAPFLNYHRWCSIVIMSAAAAAAAAAAADDDDDDDDDAVAGCCVSVHLPVLPFLPHSLLPSLYPSRRVRVQHVDPPRAGQ